MILRMIAFSVASLDYAPILVMKVFGVIILDALKCPVVKILQNNDVRYRKLEKMSGNGIYALVIRKYRFFRILQLSILLAVLYISLKYKSLMHISVFSFQPTQFPELLCKIKIDVIMFVKQRVFVGCV